MRGRLEDPELGNWSPSFEWTYGKPRLRGIREMMECSNLNDKADVDLVVQAYVEWVKFHEYLLIEGKNEVTKEKLRIGVLCSKRGNEVHAKRLDHRLGFLNSGKMRGIKFFNASDFKTEHATSRTRLLWVTFTQDSKRCSCRESWESNTHEMSLVKKRLEAKYGKVEWLWFPQGFPDRSGSAYGQCHVHGVLLFTEHEFTVKPMLDKDEDGREKLVYRVNEREELREAIGWHSFIDVKALSSMSGAVNYCRKYGQNAVSGENQESNVNNAMAWLFGKHSYNMSHGFRGALNDLIRASANSAMVQIDLLGNELVEVDPWVWHCYGVWSWNDLANGQSQGDPPWVLSVPEDVFKRCRAQFRCGSNIL